MPSINGIILVLFLLGWAVTILIVAVRALNNYQNGEPFDRGDKFLLFMMTGCGLVLGWLWPLLAVIFGIILVAKKILEKLNQKGDTHE